MSLSSSPPQKAASLHIATPRASALKGRRGVPLPFRKPVPTPPANVKIRGSALLPTKAFIEREFGLQGWQTFLTLLPIEAAVHVTNLEAMRDYPFATGLAIADAVVELAGGTDVLRRLAVHNLDYATNTFFRVIFKLQMPQYMVQKSDLVWRKYYSSGEMRAFTQKGSARVELHDFAYSSENYDRVLLHSVEAVILKAGAVVLSAEQTMNAAAGDPHTEFRYSWR